MLFVHDHCHMIFGALDSATSREELWEELREACQHFAAFLRNAHLKRRYVRNCQLVGRDKHAMAKTVFGPVDFKWEYLHMFLVELLPLLPIMHRTFNAALVLKGEEKEPSYHNSGGERCGNRFGH